MPTPSEQDSSDHCTHRHKFDLAGLGPAPYRYLGTRENLYQPCPGVTPQPGGSCDYCSNGIRWEVWFRAADGREFKVGTDCAESVSSSRAMSRIVSDAKKTMRASQRERRIIRERERIDAAVVILESDATFREFIASRPHSRGFVDRDTGKALTMLDEWEWLRANAGHTGLLKLARAIETARSERD